MLDLKGHCKRKRVGGPTRCRQMIWSISGRDGYFCLDARRSSQSPKGNTVALGGTSRRGRKSVEMPCLSDYRMLIVTQAKLQQSLANGKLTLFYLCQASLSGGRSSSQAARLRYLSVSRHKRAKTKVKGKAIPDNMLGLSAVRIFSFSAEHSYAVKPVDTPA